MVVYKKEEDHDEKRDSSYRRTQALKQSAGGLKLFEKRERGTAACRRSLAGSSATL